MSAVTLKELHAVIGCPIDVIADRPLQDLEWDSLAVGVFL